VRTPLTIIVVLLALLVPLAFATHDEGGGAAAEEPAGTPVATVARRVEELRGLRFARVPEPVRVSAKEAREEGIADLDRSYPDWRRTADEALYTRLGLLPPGTDLRKVQSSVFGEQVAGYYDPRTDRLSIVEDAGGTAVVDEVTLAHELVHALEDQRAGIDLPRVDATDDTGLAYRALVEGTASAVMFEYLRRHFPPDVALGGLLGGVFAGTDTTGLPPFVVHTLVFPYVRGQAFVEELYRRAGGRWGLVDHALRDRPPASTEQVLHPDAYLRVEMPEAVRLPDVGGALGAGWTRLTSGALGEWQTAQLLSHHGQPSREPAAGWGGDRYAVWRRQANLPCLAPCVERDVIAIRWRWDTRADAAEFEPALRAAVAALPHALVATAGRETTLVLAPDPATARRVAAAG